MAGDITRMEVESLLEYTRGRIYYYDSKGLIGIANRYREAFKHIPELEGKPKSFLNKAYTTIPGGNKQEKGQSLIIEFKSAGVLNNETNRTRK